MHFTNCPLNRIRLYSTSPHIAIDELPYVNVIDPYSVLVVDSVL